MARGQAGHPEASEQDRLLRVLLSATAAGALITSLVNVLYLATATDAGRLRDLALAVALFGKPGRPRAGVYALSASPELGRLLDHPFILGSAAGFVSFLIIGLAATLLLYWAAALLAWPALALLVRLIPPRDALRGWIWQRAFPIAVLGACCAPALLPVVHPWLIGRGGAAMAGAALALAALGCMPLLLWPRCAQRLRGARAGAITVLAVLIFLAGGTSLARALRTRPDRQPAPAPHSPNVLLVSIDSLRADHVHAYGYARETTPAIDALARDGVLFQTAVSPTSWTLPAHLSLFTGLTPRQHGVVADDQRLRDDALMLAEVLWRNGYATMGIASAPYLDSAYGFSQGFDLYDDYTIAKRSFEESHRGPTSPTMLRLFDDWFAGWNGSGRQRPFFAFLHLWDVHYDYTPPPPYDTLFDRNYRGTVTGVDFETNPAINPQMAPVDLAHVIALYDGEIRYTDYYLGLILERLRGAGVLDDTVVVITADHGDEFFEHGRKGHKQALYDESVRVPLIMRFPPRIPAGRVVDEQVRLIDVPTTIMGLAGLPPQAGFGSAGPPEEYAAQDLSRWINAAAAPTLPPLPAFGHLTGDAPVPLTSLRTAQQKLIMELAGARGEELYDLTRDPGERANLAAGAPQAGAALRRELVAFGQTLRGERLAEAAPLSEESLERLRQLGYRP